MKTSDIALGLSVVLCGAAIGGWVLLHSMPWFGLLLGVSLSLPLAMFILFIRLLCRAGPCPFTLHVRDITGEPQDKDEASSKACDSIRSLSQGL